MHVHVMVNFRLLFTAHFSYVCHEFSPLLHILNSYLFTAKVYSDIGLVHTSSGHFDIASEYLDKSLNLLRSVDQRDKKLQASVYQNLGAVNNQLGQYVKAIMYHEKAIELYGNVDLMLKD